MDQHPPAPEWYKDGKLGIYGEGPTKMGGGTIQTPTAGNANDVRYTTSKDGDAV